MIAAHNLSTLALAFLLGGLADVMFIGFIQLFFFACVDCRSTCISSTIITRIHFSWWKAIYWLDSKWIGFIHTSRTHELAEHGDHVSSVYLMFWKCKISQSSHNNTRYTEQEWTYRLADLIIVRKRNSANIWICITNNRKNCISSHSRTPLTE